MPEGPVGRQGAQRFTSTVDGWPCYRLFKTALPVVETARVTSILQDEDGKRFLSQECNMTSEEVEDLVARELASGDFDYWQGITRASIHACLVPPVAEDYEDPSDPSLVRRYWTALHEDPSGRAGYTVFYSEEDRMFGLAVAGRTARYVSIGLYGTLPETLNGM